MTTNIHINGYTIIAKLNQSQELCTYLAKSTQNGEFVVLKDCDSTMLPIYRKRLTLRHKNICNILGILQSNDSYMIVQEFINGESLEAKLSREHLLSEDVAKNYIIQLCNGLNVLHKAGIIHLDINPNNIMISTDNTLKIIDLGIAREYKKNQSTDTQIFGTVGYAAPEQFGFKQSNNSTDIYAVSVLLNVMLTGHFSNVMLFPKHNICRTVIKTCTNIDPMSRYKRILKIQELLSESTSTDTPMPLRLLRRVPGFRTWKLWKMLLATFTYILLIYSIAYICIIQSSIAEKFYLVPCIISLIIVYFAPIFCITDLFRLDDTFPLNKIPWFILKLVIRGFLGFCLFMLGIILFMLSCHAF